jgi:hypothetical protein
MKRKRLSPGPMAIPPSPVTGAEQNITPSCTATHTEGAMALEPGQSLSFTHELTNVDKASERGSYTTGVTNGPAPMVTPDGSRLTTRRPGRELFPSSWLRHRACVVYDGGDLSGVLLEYCASGLVLQADGAKKLVSWDALRVVELVDA